eukprot:TRINITY_DN8502_c0_g1_i2.p1 TRINITY_DN8502_c0_g1~~TRINITY_DN8502_c0_g1_i2.p1  ORF type:complete len:308 (-),score=26.28 TRINITY_DN8502_c0_g1_i2:27-950(-)
MLATTWIFMVSGCLGTLGSLAIIVTFLRFRDLLTRSRNMLLCLSLCDLCQGLFFGAYLPRNILGTGAICRIHTALGVSSNLASALWTTALSLHMYLLVRPEPRHPRLRWYHLVCWGIPAVVLVPWLVPGFVEMDVVQEDSVGWVGWFTCLTNANLDTASFGLPLIALWGFTTVLYVRALIFIRGFDVVSGVSEAELWELQRKFALIPVVFLVTKGPALVVFTLYFAGRTAPAWVAYIHAALDPLQGFFNALLFLGLSESVRRRVIGETNPENFTPRTYHTFVKGKAMPQAIAMGADPEVCDLAGVQY